jgi:hypothetical protein
MDTTPAVIPTEIADLRDVSLTALAFGHDSDAVLSRVAGAPAGCAEGATRAFNSSLPNRD